MQGKGFEHHFNGKKRGYLRPKRPKIASNNCPIASIIGVNKSRIAAAIKALTKNNNIPSIATILPKIIPSEINSSISY